MPSLVGPDALPLGGQALAERSAFPSLYPQVNERADTDPVCLANQGLRGQNASMEEGIFGHPYEG